jgi:hypothetical protein
MLGKDRERSEAIARHISSATLGEMSGRPIEVILLDGENPDAVEVKLVPHEEMDPEVARDLGQLVIWTDAEIRRKS